MSTTRIETGATSLLPVSASIWQHVIVSLLWFALSAQWMTVVPIVVPDQVAVIAGGASSANEWISGTILAAGAVVALVVAPISGALSDRSQHPRGRRRLFLIGGTLGSSIGLLGRASAWLNIMTVGGTVAGNIVVVATYQTGHPSGTIAVFAALNILGIVTSPLGLPSVPFSRNH